MEHKEIEVRFLEINKDDLVNRLKELDAEDLGEDLLEEVIFYDRELKWKDSGKKFVRIRKANGKIILTYKCQDRECIDGTEEVEFEVSSFAKAEVLLERIGLIPFRHQQKKRHKFMLGDVTIDIDTWPKIPTYVELEGESEEDLKKAAEKIGLDWKDVTHQHPRTIIEQKYNVPVGDMKWFTFDRFE